MKDVVGRQQHLALEYAPEHFDMLHKEAHATVLVWEALRQGGRWTKLSPNDPGIPNILKAWEGSVDTYVSVNEFDDWILTHLLRSLRALYVDVEGSADLAILLEYLELKRLPEPSLAVLSGRGIHLYWLLKALPPKVLPVWQRVQDKLVDSLRLFGSDPVARDCTRILRLVGSVNSKNGEIVRGQILTGRYWGLHEIADQVLGSRKASKKGEVRDIRVQAAKQGKTTPREYSGSIYERWYKVYQDLLLIARYHREIPTGHRDEWLFLAAVALSWFTSSESLENEIVHAAKTYTPGLKSGEVKKVSKLVCKKAEAAACGKKVRWNGRDVDPRYHLRRATLYRLLKGIIPDDLLPRLRAVIPDRLASERKKERDHARYEDHYTGEGVRISNEDKRASARLMRANGSSLRKIAAELGVSHEIVRRWCL